MSRKKLRLNFDKNNKNGVLNRRVRSHDKDGVITSRSMIIRGFGARGSSVRLSTIGTPSFLTSASMYRSFLSISSHRRTSFTNFR